MQNTRRLRRLVLAGLMALGTYGLSATAFAADAGLHVDQVGYLTNHTKVAMVSAAADDSFKLVDAKTGKTVYEGTMESGKTETWKGKEKVVITAGNAGAVEMKVNGKDVGKAGNAGQVVEKTFTADKADLSADVATADKKDSK